MNGTVLPAELSGSGRSAVDPLLAPHGRYLVGYDGSQASRVALRWVTSRARYGPHEVVLVGVVDEDDDDIDERISARRLGTVLSDRAAELSDARDGLVVTTRLAAGEVAPALASALRPGDALVVGSDKTGYAQGRVYGFRSIQLVAAVPGTVVVVPAVDLRMRTGVVVALDDRAGSSGLVRMAALEADRRRTALLLVHAVPPGSGPGRRRRGEELLQAARELAGEAGRPPVVTRLLQRRTADAILNLSRDSTLLLVGRSRGDGPLAVGSTLHELLMNANAPTVIA